MARPAWEIVFDPKNVVPELRQRVVVLGRPSRPKRMPIVQGGGGRGGVSVESLIGSVGLLDREALYVLPLDNKGRLIGIYVAHIGGTSSTVAEIATILRLLLVTQAHSTIIVHNHPSGYTEPSREDIVLTKHVEEAFEPFGIRLVDHLIIGQRDKPFSFAAARMLKEPT